MKEFDLKDIWNSGDQAAQHWYEQIRPDLLEKARKQSDHTLYKLKRLAIGELVFNLISAFVVLYLSKDVDWRIGIIVFLFILSIGYLAFRQYLRFSRAVQNVPTLNVLASTEAYLQLIRDYSQRITQLAKYITPFAIGFGFLLGFELSSSDSHFRTYDWESIAITAFVLIILMAFTYYFSKWYYQYFIGSKADELEEMLNNLQND